MILKVSPHNSQCTLLLRLYSVGHIGLTCCAKESIVDSLAQGLLEGRTGSSLLLTPHQLQQLQQLQAQQEQAGGALTFTLQHQHTAGNNVGPQLVLAPPPPGFTYSLPQHPGPGSDIIGHIGHTSILQSSIHHHVRQSSILQTTLQQASSLQSGVRSVEGGKCVSASPGSPFSSRSLTPSPQQRVLTPQPHIHQVMGAPAPQLLQIIHHQQATRNSGFDGGVKGKQPPQILPKPPGAVTTSGGGGGAKVGQPTSHVTSNQQQGTLLFNQMLPGGPMLVQQQTSSGVQLILRSPPPQPQPKPGSIVLSGPNGQGTVLLGGGRHQAHQVVRLITGQSLQLQQIQTASGPALIAVPTTHQQAPPPQPPPPATTPPHHIKKNKKKKRRDEDPPTQPQRLDLANLMKLSGIEDEDVTPVTQHQPSQQQQQQQQLQQHQQNHRIVVTPPRSTTPKQSQLVAQLQAPTQCGNSGLRLSLSEDGRMVVHQSPAAQTTVSPSVAAAAHSQLAQLLADHGGLLQNSNVVASPGSKEALLQTLQNAVLQLANTGSEMGLGTPSILVNTGGARRTPSVVVTNPNLVDAAHHNGVRILNGIPAAGSMADRVQIVSGVQNTEQQSRMQIVAGGVQSSMAEQPGRAQNLPNALANTMSLSEQNRTHVVQSIPNAPSGVTLREQQNRVQIVSNVSNSSSLSLTEQQNRLQIVSEFQNSEMPVHEKKRVQVVSGVQVPASTADHHNRVIEQQNKVQMLSSIPASHDQSRAVQAVSGVKSSAGMSVTNQNRVQIVSGVPNSNALSISQQNRVQIVSGVQSSLSEQQNRVQIVSGIQNSNAIGIAEQNSVQIVSAQSSLNSSIMSEHQNRVQIVSGVPNPNVGLGQSNRVHIVSGVPNSMVDQTSTPLLTEHHNRVHIVTGVPSSSGLLEHQNRVQIVTGIQNSAGMLTEQQSRVQIVSGVPNTNLSLSGQQSRVQIVNAQNSAILEQNRVLHQNMYSEQQRLVQQIVTSGASEQQKLVQHIVTSGASREQQKLVQHIVTSGAGSEQQKLVQHIVTSGASEQQKLVHQVVTSGASDQQKLVQHIVTSSASSEQQKLVQHIMTSGISEQQRFVQQIVTSGANEQQQRLLNRSVESALPNICERVEIVNSSAGVELCERQLVTSANSSVQHRVVVNSEDQQRGIVFTGPHHRGHHVQVVGANNHEERNTLKQEPRLHHKTPPSGRSPVLSSTPHPPVAAFSNRPNLTVVTQPYHSDPHHQPKVAVTVNQDHPPVITNCHSAASNSSPPKPLQSITRQQQSPHANNQQSFQNAFLESIAQSHPSLVINKSANTPPLQPKVQIKGKKMLTKKAAVVKPMMMTPEDHRGEEPPSLVPIAYGSAKPAVVAPPPPTPPPPPPPPMPSESHLVQRVQTIQLTPQKQQHLKAVQNQIIVLNGKKSRTTVDQAALQRLFLEQQKILFSGKLVPTIPGQHAQGLAFVSTPVRLPQVPATSAPSSVCSTSTNSPRLQPLLPPPQSQPQPSPTLTNKATSPIHVQVGTQTMCEPSPSPPLPSLSSCKRAALLEQQLHSDEAGATAPDTSRPFSGRSDACKRLVRYHCLDDPVLSERDLHKADEIFEATARHLLDKNTQMLNKYNYLLLMESMRQVQTSELIMLGRMFVADETTRLEQMRQEATHPQPPPGSKREREEGQGSSEGESKKHCPDDEEINAQVQSAIDSILNLQRTDPALDEAVRSILTS